MTQGVSAATMERLFMSTKNEMKPGDLIHMPGQTLLAGEEVPAIGIVIDTEPRHLNDKRVGVMWTDNWGEVDWEPKAWLEVISSPDVLNV